MVVARRSVHLRSLVAAVAFACLLLGVGAAAARADTATLSVKDAAGNQDPVARLGRTFTLTGSSSAPESVYAKFRPTGGAPCAPSADSDTGDYLDQGSDEYGFLEGEDVNGSFALSRTFTWDAAGSYQFCFWIADSSTATATPITQVVMFRAPGGSITGSFAPASVGTDGSTTLTATGTAEAPEEVFATIRPAGGAPCAATAASDSGRSVINDEDVNGSFSVSGSVSEEDAGTYLICLYLASSSSSAAVAVNSLMLTVGDGSSGGGSGGDGTAAPSPSFSYGRATYRHRTGALKLHYSVADATRVHFRLRIAGRTITNQTFRVSDGGFVLTSHLHGTVRRYANRAYSFVLRGSAVVSGPGGRQRYGIATRLTLD